MSRIALILAMMSSLTCAAALADGGASKHEWDAVKKAPRVYVPTRRPEHERLRRELQSCLEACAAHSEAERGACEVRCRESR
jgi:hypothetical protein